MIMASPVEKKEDLTSLEKEDVFITETAELARLFFEIQHKRKVAAECHAEHSVVPKGVGPSRPVAEHPVLAAIGDNAHQAAEYLGSRLREMEATINNIVIQEFNGFLASNAQTIWDIDYPAFQTIISNIIRTQPVINHLDKIVLILAGALHISEALRVVGNDTDRQNQYAGYVARFIADQELMLWVEQQGGWERIGTPV